MTGRLFWKILLAFFIAYAVQLIIFSAVFILIVPGSPKVELRDYRAIQGVMLDIAAAGLERKLIAPVDPRFFGGGGAPLVARRVDNAPPPHPVIGPTRIVETAPGMRYLVAPRDPPPVRQQLGRLPVWLYLNGFGLVVGLLFAAALGLYLARPIRLLRDGLGAFAAGDLQVRLGMSGRRDEIADLARDFDGMADRIERLVRTREQLIADVSHELRTPLTRLRLAIALARQRPERTATALDRVEHEAGRLDEIVGELLTLSRLESGAADMQSYFDLSDLLRKLIADARYESGTVQVLLDEAEEQPAGGLGICGDAELVRRAIENILRNAIRYSPPDGTITVSLRQRPATACITIEDEGPGASHADLKTLFDPFVRGAGGGFGLGLAIARRAVLAHGGSIVAENRPSGGLRIVISLPTERVIG